MKGEKVICGVDNYQGHKDKFRAGVVIDIDAARSGITFVNVLCPPRGRERIERVIKECAHSLLRDTPEVRGKLAANGFDPDKPFGIHNGEFTRPV